MLRKFSVTSLFSGAGGLDLDFAQSGLFEIVFASDVPAQPCGATLPT